MTMQYGIIGCQHAHIEIFMEEMGRLGYRCAGIYESGDRGLAERIADKYGCPVLDTVDRLLAPDIAIIGSSAINSEKIAIIELCEQHGKSIMVDKPAIVNSGGLERLRAVIERGKIQVGMLLTERYHPAIYTLKQLIDAGELGELVTIGMRKPHRLNAASRPDWFFDKALCGGILIDLLIHDYDLLHWLMGADVEASAGVVGKSVLPEHPTFYNTVQVQATLSDGRVAQLYADWHTPEQSWTWGDGRIFVTGTRGFAELRLSGEPGTDGAPLLLLVSDVRSWGAVELQSPPVSITEDFLRRCVGAEGALTHQDILAAHEAVIQADREVRYVEPAGEGGERR